MIAVVGRALLWLLCAMTAPNPPVPPPATIQPRPAPPSSANLCHECRHKDRRDGSHFCGDACQTAWTTRRNRAIPLPIAPPTLPDGNHYRRTC